MGIGRTDMELVYWNEIEEMVRLICLGRMDHANLQYGPVKVSIARNTNHGISIVFSNIYD